MPAADSGWPSPLRGDGRVRRARTSGFTPCATTDGKRRVIAREPVGRTEGIVDLLLVIFLVAARDLDHLAGVRGRQPWGCAGYAQSGLSRRDRSHRAEHASARTQISFFMHASLKRSCNRWRTIWPFNSRYKTVRTHSGHPRLDARASGRIAE